MASSATAVRDDRGRFIAARLCLERFDALRLQALGLALKGNIHRVWARRRSALRNRRRSTISAKLCIIRFDGKVRIACVDDYDVSPSGGGEEGVKLFV